MPTQSEIKAAILNAVGNTSADNIAEIADELAKAVWQLENKNSNNPAKDVRVIDTKETR